MSYLKKMSYLTKMPYLTKMSYLKKMSYFLMYVIKYILYFSNFSLSDLADLNLGTCNSNLGLLDLSRNRLRTLDSDVLKQMVHLKALNFSHNGINQVSFKYYFGRW